MNAPHFDTLSEDRLKAISAMLSQFKKKSAMRTVDEVDGFFTGLQCVPEIEQPDNYLREIWGGGKTPGSEAFENEQQSKTFFEFIPQHWNNVRGRLDKDDFFIPIVMEEHKPGMAWASGFLRAMICAEIDIFYDKEMRDITALITVLAIEGIEPLPDDLREEILSYLPGTVAEVRTHVSTQWISDLRHAFAIEKESWVIRRDTPKIGRNAPCPCGSGKKYKKCCAVVAEDSRP